MVKDTPVLAVEPVFAEHEDVARVWDDLVSGCTVGTSSCMLASLCLYRTPTNANDSQA